VLNDLNRRLLSRSRGRLFEAFVSEPKNVEPALVAVDQVFAIVCPPALLAQNTQDVRIRPRARVQHSQMCDRSLREMIRGEINCFDASGLPPYFACGDLPQGNNDISVIRFYERLGPF
jgi:hypothetical protein